MFGWTPTEITALFLALATPFGALLAYIQWYIARLDKKEADKAVSNRLEREAEAKRQDELRDEMSAEFDRKVGNLENIVKSQGALLALYVRHVRNLEILVAQNGLEVPTFEIPDHLKDFWYGQKV